VLVQATQSSTWFYTCADGGIVGDDDASGPPTGAVAEVIATFTRNQLGSDAATGEVLASASVSMQLPSGVSASPSTFQTDVNGMAAFELRVPKGITDVPIVLTIDNHVTTTLTVTH
jgi:hypothetical protein